MVNAIKLFRENKKMSQHELGALVGVTQGAVHQWEIGLTKPRADMLIRLAEVLEVSIDDLLATERKGA